MLQGASLLVFSLVIFGNIFKEKRHLKFGLGGDVDALKLNKGTTWKGRVELAIYVVEIIWCASARLKRRRTTGFFSSLIINYKQDNFFSLNRDDADSLIVHTLHADAASFL
ncbi:hypothetical protein RIF29_28384 [Crotalaria pallida]|uniref:Uncharacterized protein n=1 Tax=Crotalaria pallida TaxID=3830 RepID=A0AAN9EHV1_CROPI